MQVIKLNDDIYSTFIIYTASEWKKEVYKRVQALGYEMPKINDFNYIKYDCIEWMELRELKITVQRCGEWLQVVEKFL